MFEKWNKIFRKSDTHTELNEKNCNMTFTFKGKKYKPINDKKVRLAKEKVEEMASNLLKNYKDDDEMFLFILMELKTYGECGLEVLDNQIGFKGIKEFISLEEIK